MKKITYIFTLLLLIVLFKSCGTAELVDYWKNSAIDTLKINKILIVGMTPNKEARKLFEEKLKNEYESRGVEAVTSLSIFDADYSLKNKTEEEIKFIENVLTANFFDAVIFTKIKGVENVEIYNKDFTTKDRLDIRFKEDYKEHEIILNNPKYYEEYSIYHAETSLYCICPTKDRELMFKGAIDITDPKLVDKTVNDYVKVLTLALEEFNLLPTLNK